MGQKAASYWALKRINWKIIHVSEAKGNQRNRLRSSQFQPLDCTILWRSCLCWHQRAFFLESRSHLWTTAGFQQCPISPLPAVVTDCWHHGNWAHSTWTPGCGSQLLQNGSGAVISKGKTMLWGGGESGSYTSAALQEGITMGGSKAWDLEAPTHWFLLEWLLSLSSPLKTCSHWFSFSASEGDRCLLCLHRDISHHGLLVLLHHHLLKLMPCTPGKALHQSNKKWWLHIRTNL